MLLSLDGADSSVAEGLVSVDEKLVVAEERPPPTPPGPHGMLLLLPEVCIYMQFHTLFSYSGHMLVHSDCVLFLET